MSTTPPPPFSPINSGNATKRSPTAAGTTERSITAGSGQPVGTIPVDTLHSLPLFSFKPPEKRSSSNHYFYSNLEPPPPPSLPPNLILPESLLPETRTSSSPSSSNLARIRILSG
ncbi:hypothetical protein NA56DRAFT_707314 [Hyaloscypha hepaticicola]|uniref:Uncharacterized protein n=1 Tax=Hyaloscypha hepaticicola TaxID=2082293 RepID=A0A2J6PV67_9HELO|nr:hypothetical protein NA56DRAFT_707314 [Hyaloscypha hepaticicola]